MQNIGADNAGDAFYRYKMPKIQARIEGRGNGIKTNVVNNVDIAKALERPPDYIVKYYGCELGAQTKYDPKTGTSIVNGAHDIAKLAELLEGFIKKYVQCYACGNPETVFKFKKECIFLKCKACGAISDVDMRHKVNTYILRHPPDQKLSKAEEKLKKQEKQRLKGVEGDDKKKKKKDNEDKQKKGTEAGDDSPSAENGDEDDEENAEEEDDVVWMTDTSEAAIKKRAAEQLSAATAALVTQGNIEAEITEAKRKAEEEAVRKAEEEARQKAEEEERKQAEEARIKAERDKQLAEEAARKLELQNGNASLISELRGLAVDGKVVELVSLLDDAEVAGGTANKIKILYQALFGDVGSSKMTALANKYKKVLLQFAQPGASQMAQLLALEYLVAEEVPSKRKELPLMLKFMYDTDIADEEIILAWFGKGNAGKLVGVKPQNAEEVRNAARPFVDWLQTADDDDSEEED